MHTEAHTDGQMTHAVHWLDPYDDIYAVAAADTLDEVCEAWQLGLVQLGDDTWLTPDAAEELAQRILQCVAAAREATHR